MRNERQGVAMIVLGGVIALIVVIVLFTRGGDSDVASTTEETVTSTSEASTVPTTSVARTTTTTVASTTTTIAEEPEDAALTLARMALGTYEGEWVNTTFGSTGSITVVVTLDEATRVLTITFDLGGNVFGGSDPPPIAIDLDIDDESSELTSALFGDVSVSIDDGNFVLSAENIPGPGIARMNVTGVVGLSGSNMAYAIEFDDGSAAQGTASLGSVIPPADTATDTTSAADADADADETVEEFFPEYLAAIEGGDIEFLFDRLHPVVLAQPSADLCRAFIEREILALVNYRITGDITGPVSQTIAGTTVSEVFSAPVAFVFQGQSFDGTATFAAVDRQMRWFTECR